MSKYRLKPLRPKESAYSDKWIADTVETLRRPSLNRKPIKAGAPWWLVVVLSCVSAFLLIVYARAIWPEGGEGEVSPVSFDGTAVLVLEDESRTPRESYESGQIASLGYIENWARDNADDFKGTRAFRKFDKESDLSEIDPFWREFRDVLTKDPPAAAVLSDNRLLEFEIEDVQTTKENLEQVK